MLGCVKFPFVCTHLPTNNISMDRLYRSFVGKLYVWWCVFRFISIHTIGVWIASGPSELRKNECFILIWIRIMKFYCWQMGKWHKRNFNSPTVFGILYITNSSLYTSFRLKTFARNKILTNWKSLQKLNWGRKRSVLYLFIWGIPFSF